MVVGGFRSFHVLVTTASSSFSSIPYIRKHAEFDIDNL